MLAGLTDGGQVQATGALRRAIVSGLLRPGEAPLEALRARRSAAGRPPGREALEQLDRERPVEVVPRAGTCELRVLHRRHLWPAALER